MQHPPLNINGMKFLFGEMNLYSILDRVVELDGSSVAMLFWCSKLTSVLLEYASHTVQYNVKSITWKVSRYRKFILQRHNIVVQFPW